MKYAKIIVITALVALTSSCSLFNRKHNAGAAAEVNGHILEYTKLDALTAGLSPEDSAHVAEAYIRQWATEILLYDKARNRINDKNLDEMVEDYRRGLYAHAYEQHLLQKMPKEVSQTELDSFYQAHPSKYVLKEDIVRGILVIVPNGAPDLNKLQKYMQQPDEQNIENIEKYTYRYANGYELFLNEWKSTSQLLLWLPLEKNDLRRMVKQNRQIMVADSISTYVLHITDMRQVGDLMPMEYAQKEIEPIILRERSNAFLQEERNRIYDDAVRFKKVKLYENK